MDSSDICHVNLKSCCSIYFERYCQATIEQLEHGLVFFNRICAMLYTHTHTHTHTTHTLLDLDLVYHCPLGHVALLLEGARSALLLLLLWSFFLWIPRPPALLNHFSQIGHWREPRCSCTGLLRSSRHLCLLRSFRLLKVLPHILHSTPPWETPALPAAPHSAVFSLSHLWTAKPPLLRNHLQHTSHCAAHSLVCSSQQHTTHTHTKEWHNSFSIGSSADSVRIKYVSVIPHGVHKLVISLHFAWNLQNYKLTTNTLMCVDVCFSLWACSDMTFPPFFLLFVVVFCFVF